jgi:hypothetical protein
VSVNPDLEALTGTIVASLGNAYGWGGPQFKCDEEGRLMLTPNAVLLLDPETAQKVSNAILRQFNIRPQPYNILPDLGDEEMPQTDEKPPPGSTVRIKPEAWERYLRKNHLSAKKPDPGPQPVEASREDGVKLAWPDCWWNHSDVEPVT